jgi:hypothetical protein
MVSIDFSKIDIKILLESDNFNGFICGKKRN